MQEPIIINKYQSMEVSIQDGIAMIVFNRPERLNACDEEMHAEMGAIWKDMDADPRVKVCVVTGKGHAFCAGGEMSMVERIATDPRVRERTEAEARSVVYNMVNCSKPIISAINGPAVGAGLVVALMADISIASEDAKFADGHVRLGVAAGDHACAIWPILCGMAKAKLYLLTGDFISAKEAERIGLVSKVVPREKVVDTAMVYAKKLASGPQYAISYTKYALNQWIRSVGFQPFDLSLALEMKNFSQEDVRHGIQAFKNKSTPRFPSAKL